MTSAAPSTDESRLDQIAGIARRTLQDIEAPFAAAAAEIQLRVTGRAPGWMLDELGIAHPLDLTGLYEGVPVTQRSVIDPPLEPPVIWLFADAILDELESRGNVTLQELVHHVTIHELAHHLGWSDSDIARIDPWWE